MQRIVDALGAAIADVRTLDDVPPVQATFAWAAAPQDAAEPGELFRLADQRLLARKREAKRLAPAA
jgi:hypothetical protein